MQPVPVTQAIVDVVAFVDWNAQLLLTKKDCTADPEGAAEAAFKQTARRIARCLDSVVAHRRFRVAAKLVLVKTDFAALSQRSNVVFSPLVEFGDYLLHAATSRLHPKLNCHLPNTVRSRHGSEIEEKMVDTALAADVVACAHRDSKNWIVVVTEDDDLIPPVYAAELALSGTHARVIILQKKIRASMLSLENILING